MLPHQVFNNTVSLSPEAIDDLQAIFTCYVAESGIILPDIAQQNKVIWVETGLLRAYHEYKGQEITTWFVGTEQFLYSAPSPHVTEVSYTHVSFLSKTVYHVCHWEALQALYLKYPPLSQAGKVLLEKLLRRYNHVLYLLRFFTPPERLTYFEQHYADVYTTAPLKHIASFLGIAPETLSRLRKRHQKAAKGNIS